jgi:hypothetical protein
MKICLLKIVLKIFNRFKFCICNGLNNSVRNWSKQQAKLACTAFIAINSGISIYIASKAIFEKPDFSLFKRSQIPEPILPPSYPDYHFERTLLLHKKMEHIKKYLDSLSLHDTSRYQAILKANPRLLKNIQSIELLFHQLNQK